MIRHTFVAGLAVGILWASAHTSAAADEPKAPPPAPTTPGVSPQTQKINEYIAKGYMVADAIRFNRTDGALVRVITQVMPSESLETAEARAIHFTQQMAPNLPRFIPN